MAPHYETLTFLYISTAFLKQLESPVFFPEPIHPGSGNKKHTHKVDPELIVINGVITLEATMA